jgi:hypothetical protein
LQHGHNMDSVMIYCAHNVHHFCPLEYRRLPGRNFENFFNFSIFDSFLSLSQYPEHTWAIFLKEILNVFN